MDNKQTGLHRFNFQAWSFSVGKTGTYAQWFENRWPKIRTQVIAWSESPAIAKFVDVYAGSLSRSIDLMLASSETSQEITGALIDAGEELYGQVESMIKKFETEKESENE